MSYVRLCCRVIHHKRIAWIPPVLGLVFFVIYFSFFMEYSSPVERVGDLYGSTCMCGRCRPEKRRTEWFNAHFNGTVDPILTGKDHKIPEVVQKWWLKLQGSNNASHIPEILDQMFKVIPSGNPYKEKENRPCRTCAVVGNSGNLKGSKFGMKIDSHGFILRMNGARTAGFEEDVGSRTTHHFMYPESAINLPPGVNMVLIPFKLQDLKWITSALTTGEVKFTYTRVKRYISVDTDKILIFNPAFFKYVHDNWTNHHGKYPSTGMLALFFALHICDEISVFGFGADSNGNWHHYWEQNRFAGAFRRTGVHNAEFESNIISKLVQEERLKLYK